jgi:hypothetical protein
MTQHNANPNSPKNFFSDWLFKQTLAYHSLWHKDKSIWGESLLNHIFCFARDHGKTYEMFMWLDSNECYKLFQREDAGKMILKKYEELRSNVSDNVDLLNVDDVTSEIDNYYSNPDDVNITSKLKLV